MPTVSVAQPCSAQAEIVSLLPALKAFARRFERVESDADDLVQETVSKALCHIAQFQDGTSLKSWLFTIMRNTYCSSYKRRKREPVGCVGDLTGYQLPVKSTQEWSLRALDVQAAIDKLGASHRHALLLVVNGTSYEEAAAICDCQVGTIKSRVSRARNHLLEMLGETQSSEAASLH
ncbi:RNA polymerase sigma-70 factor, ECF subfamily [Rhizobium mongolense subsp. loessense]|uniref:RNA polymerase sigma-70 factor, ECF subfamily n=1 Tax=Rhizobium mongolense subsp. loessense TaxID=158890 RepID=A0A1G4TX10_9HYPH|nr:sigma-70 family RNA polymerase sigma factor [Rhizobium mongolense]SCW85858.1 RNA polymerase sigma-70 factor, ECF subfamily [Rhizobium mongolense subsp. loessense]